jgi:probable HAF family extracellular repeat protein
VPPCTRCTRGTANSFQNLRSGTLGGTESFANIISDRGHVGGAANLPDGTRHGFLYDGALHDLGALSGSTFSAVFGVNNRGQAFGGSALPGTSIFHAVTFAEGDVSDLGTLGGLSSFAVRVSEAGAVTGRADVPAGFSRAFYFHDGVMYDIGVLPGDTLSNGRDLNNRGEVAVQSCGPTGCRGFVWWNGTMTELGSLGGTQTNPLAINDRGQVVGSSRTATSGTSTHAFLWENGEIVDLNDLIVPGSGWVLQQATCINASGQIVGTGLLNGQVRAFLLTLSSH